MLASGPMFCDKLRNGCGSPSRPEIADRLVARPVTVSISSSPAWRCCCRRSWCWRRSAWRRCWWSRRSPRSRWLQARIVQALPRFVVIAMLLAALGCWGAASALWSIIPGHSFFEGIRFLGESACGLCLLARDNRHRARATRTRLARALTGGIVVALALLMIERFADAPIIHWWHGTPPSQFETLAPLRPRRHGAGPADGARGGRSARRFGCAWCSSPQSLPPQR